MPKYLVCPKVFNEGGQIEQELRIFVERKTSLFLQQNYEFPFTQEKKRLLKL